jgi:phage terminase large subunit-like protein
MSFSELLIAVKALPQAEKFQLMQALVDEVRSSLDRTREAEEVSKLFPQGAVLHTGWQVTTDEAGMRAIQELLASRKDKE